MGTAQRVGFAASLGAAIFLMPFAAIAATKARTLWPSASGTLGGGFFMFGAMLNAQRHLGEVVR